MLPVPSLANIRRLDKGAEYGLRLGMHQPLPTTSLICIRGWCKHSQEVEIMLSPTPRKSR
jgi:hypothetical protein